MVFKASDGASRTSFDKTCKCFDLKNNHNIKSALTLIMANNIEVLSINGQSAV